MELETNSRKLLKGLQDAGFEVVSIRAIITSSERATGR